MRSNGRVAALADARRIECLDVEREGAPFSELFVGRLRHAVVEPFDGDAPVVAVQCEQPREDVQCVRDGASVEAGVEVTLGRPHDELDRSHAA